ncbi:hypothetical protein Terro_0433 [Terriglobus roseus DSM 18391]|uniref:Uncharacterized protein n=1 Tax=Terriglobus roseus (strain DSM 18391 / NRRL B-41598 / KBS 63) TaxID=926566 RepID=I3ZC11_TERRK|nr:hypothetical protein [Terriglobus roseus]AFL86779.1 hypothetical protein Terro_0433 [Terriglobus roseus DSM 18391]
MTTQEILAAIDAEISKLQQVRAALSGYSDPTVVKRGPGRPKKIVAPVKAPAKRVLSDAARAKIAAAQKKRWAASRKAAK